MGKKEEQALRKKIARLVEKDPELVMGILLEKPFWPEGLNSEKDHRRFGDDNNSFLRVVFSSDGDAWPEVWEHRDPEDPMYGLRFRTFFGGGSSLRTRAALCILAKAIDMDNVERPQQRKPSQ